MANWITLSRLPLLIVYVLMLYYGNAQWRIAAVPFLFILILLDTVDGIVARATESVSLVGSVLDIAADRVYELVLWVCYADLDVIPVAIPLIVIIRTTLTDALRSIGVREGERAFDQHRTRLGTFLVSSRFMRSAYGIAKIIAFCGLSLGIALGSYPPGTSSYLASGQVLAAFVIVSWVAVGLCVLRGLPVVVGAARRAWNPS